MEDYITEPKDRLIRFGPDEIENIRKKLKLDNKDDREKAIAIIDEWVKSQKHFIKKDFSKGYIERCIVTCKGSLERTKQQIDLICTMRTHMPHLFQITSLKDQVLAEVFAKGRACFLPKLTKDYYRIVVVKASPNMTFESSHISLLFLSFLYAAEYLKSNEYCLGFRFVFDISDISLTDVITKLNLIELQQMVPVFTQGYGCKIKSVYLLTSSKFIETLLRLLKPLFSEKIANRIHAVSDRQMLKDLIQPDILPVDYGGPERSVEDLYEDLIESLSTVPVQDLVKEMKRAVVDESKRQIDKFNAEYIGMPGTFRTLSID